MNGVGDDDDEIDKPKFCSNTLAVPTITTTPVFVSNKEVVSNLNVVDADDDDIDNEKLQLEYKNLIGDLDGT